MTRAQRSLWSAGAVALVLGACATPPEASPPPEDRPAPEGPTEDRGPGPVQQVDDAFDAMREENRRRVREIAESSREMEAERQRVIDRVRERAAERSE